VDSNVVMLGVTKLLATARKQPIGSSGALQIDSATWRKATARRSQIVSSRKSYEK